MPTMTDPDVWSRITGGRRLHKAAFVLAILDRNEGGSDAIRQRGYKFEALLTAGEDGRIRPA